VIQTVRVAAFSAQAEAKRLRSTDMQMERKEIKKINLMMIPQKKKKRKNNLFCRKRMKHFQFTVLPKFNMS
jgi:hypothetical protein